MRKIFAAKESELIANFIALWQKISLNAIKNHGEFFVALSGGKSPIPFYQELAKQKNLPWEKTHIFLADERAVAKDHQDSNQKLIRENLINFVPANFYPINTEKNSLYAANDYEKNLPDHFDLIVLGIGNDGHTASIFPENLANLSKTKSVVVTKSSTAKHERISLNYPAINRAKNIIFIVTGKEKAKIAAKIIYKNSTEYPATLVGTEKTHIFYLTSPL